MTDSLTRLQLLRRAAAGGAFLTVPGVLAACGGSSKSAATTSSAKQDAREDAPLLQLDALHGHEQQDAQLSVADRVREEVRRPRRRTPTDINDNASYFGKIQGALSRGQSIDRDIVVLTDNDRYLSLMIKKGWAEKLDKSAIPNMKNLVAVQQHPSFDPNRDYSLPWQSGMTGIAYNDKLTDPVLTIEELLTNPKLKGKITCLNSMGDALTIVMLANGDDPTKVTDKSFNAAFNVIKKAVDSKQIRQFTGNDYAPLLAKGDLSAAMSWSGDIAQLGNPHIHWNVPTAGGALWTDNMLIPKGGNIYTACFYMNYVYDPKVQGLMEAGDPKKNITGIYYIPPVAGAGEWAKKVDPAVAKNTLIFPTQKMLDSVKIFDSNALNNQKYLQAWQNLVSG